MAALDEFTNDRNKNKVEFINICKVKIGKHAYTSSSGENYYIVSVSL